MVNTGPHETPTSSNTCTQSFMVRVFRVAVTVSTSSSRCDMRSALADVRTVACFSIVYSEKETYRSDTTRERKDASMSTGNATHQPDEGAVLLEQQGPIATITLSHPAALNALTWVMYQQMEAHLERLAADETTRVIILRGAG